MAVPFFVDVVFKPFMTENLLTIRCLFKHSHRVAMHFVFEFTYLKEIELSLFVLI